jgi:hypothetical protein
VDVLLPRDLVVFGAALLALEAAGFAFAPGFGFIAMIFSFLKVLDKSVGGEPKPSPRSQLGVSAD